MAKIVRRSVDNSIENNILTASIISTKFIEEIYPIYDRKYMVSTFASVIMKWVLDYFDKFGEAPKHHIQDIFTIEKQTLDDAELDIIETFLLNLSKKYTEDQGINDEYILDQALLYFRKREIEVRVSTAQKMLDIGRVDKAEEELNQMKKVMKLTSRWHNPLTTESVNAIFDERNQGIFTFPGALGELYGPLQRGWLVAILAPFKRGKTWMLQEAVIVAAVLGLKAVFVSLEMQDVGMDERILKRISAYAPTGATEATIPVFDCYNNQLGICSLKTCTGTCVALAESKESIPAYSPDINHKVCCYCKDKKDGQYDMSTWFETIEKPEFTPKNVHKKVKAFVKTCGDNIRIMCYPRFSADLDDVERDLDILEQTEGFIPDVGALDYVDICKHSSKGGDERFGIDALWKQNAALAARRHMLWFTASQGNRGSLYKADMDQSDLAEWIGKLAHVDVFAALNQTKDEKKRGVLRTALLAHRHQEFHEGDNCTILQSLALGQTHLDSHFNKGH
jgi:hypothetical protein